jgi:hypothetical protein
MSEDVITNPDEGFDYSKAGNEVYIEEIQDYPCARYRIDRVESLVASNIIQEIEFADTASFTYNPTFPGQAAYKVIQYNHSTSEIKTGEEYLSRIEGNVLGWSGRKLYVQCLSGVFDKHNGKVIQLDSTGNISAEGLGGNGYDLEYSDFNTTGLSGCDTDEKCSFSACVLSEGSSAEKSNDAGGSYGIGKNAVYGLSGIRTVLYSSLSLEQTFPQQGHVLPGESQGVPLLRLEFAS